MGASVRPEKEEGGKNSPEKRKGEKRIFCLSFFWLLLFPGDDDVSGFFLQLCFMLSFP